MRRPHFARWIWFVSFSLGITAHAASAGELRLAPAITHELNQVLKVSDGLHHSLLDRDDEQIEMSIRDMILQLDRAKSASMQTKPHDRRHLVRIIDAAHEQFELTQTSYGDERKLRLEDGFNQLVNLVRIYKLDSSYAIFFCPKDRTTWVQKGAKAQNPFRAEGHRDNCGIRVSK